MDSQFFNRKRFIALCRWDWTERQKALGLQAVVIYAVLTVFSGFYTIRGALRANALSHYVSPQRAEEWKVISADLAQGVDGSWTSVSALFSRFLPSTLSALHAGHKGHCRPRPKLPVHLPSPCRPSSNFCSVGSMPSHSPC